MWPDERLIFLESVQGLLFKKKENGAPKHMLHLPIGCMKLLVTIFGLSLW
jgi:hypothetical protein